MPTESGLTSAVWRLEPLGEIIRRKLIPSLEHVTWSDPTVTPSRLAISSRLIPSATHSLIFSIACGVNFMRLPLMEELAFVIVMAAPFVDPSVRYVTATDMSGYPTQTEPDVMAITTWSIP